MTGYRAWQDKVEIIRSRTSTETRLARISLGKSIHILVCYNAERFDRKK